MNFEPSTLIASFVIGSIGFVAFAYGKKQGRWPQMAVGLVLMGYPYFVSNVAWMCGIAVALLGALWGILRVGL